MISLVPDREPLTSPSMHYSRHVPLTSNFDDYDPEKILLKFERNKLVHKTYNMHLVTPN